MGTNGDAPEAPATEDEFQRCVEAARELIDGGQMLVFAPPLGGIRFQAEDAVLEQAAERHEIPARRLRAALNDDMPDLLWLAAMDAPSEVVQMVLGGEDSDPETASGAQTAERYACLADRLLTDGIKRYVRAKMRDDSLGISDVRGTVLRPASAPDAQPTARVVIKVQRGGLGMGSVVSGRVPGDEAMGTFFGRPVTYTEVYCRLEDVAYVIRQLEALRAELVAADTAEGA